MLIDRENLLMEHKIAFKPMQAMEFDIKEAQLKAALPRIVNVTAAPIGCENAVNVTTKAELVVLETPLKPRAVCVNLQTDVIVLDTPLKTEPETESRSAIKYAPLSCPIKIKHEVIEQASTENSGEQLQLDQVQCKTELEESDAIEPLSSSSQSLTMSTPPIGLIRIKCEQQLMSPETEPLQAPAELSVPAKPQRKGTPIKLSQVIAEFDEDQHEQVPTPAKPQRKGTPVRTKEEPIEFHEICEAKPLRKGTPVRVKASAMDTETSVLCPVRSILTKKRDLFAEDSNKNVQFSSNAPIVHNLSPDLCSPATCSKENAQPEILDIKPVKKSQSIIRRIVVASKKPASS